MIAQVIHSERTEAQRREPSPTRVGSPAVHASGDGQSDSDEDSPVGGIDIASLLDTFDEDGDGEDAEPGLDVDVPVIEPPDPADDQHHRMDFDAASLLTVDDSTAALDEDAPAEAATFDVEVVPVDDLGGDDEPAREPPTWFEPQLPPMDGSTDGEEALPIEQDLSSFGDEGQAVPWGAERYDVEVLSTDTPLPRSIASHEDVLYFAGAGISRLALGKPDRVVEPLYDPDTLPNQLISIAGTTREVFGCPAGPQLVAWSAESAPRRLRWPASREQSQGAHRTRIHSDGEERCWLVTPRGDVLYSADAGGTWTPQSPRDVLGVAGTGPTFALSTSGRTLRIWAQDAESSVWKRLPLETAIEASETASVHLAAHGENVALFTPRTGLQVSTSGGVEFHSVSSCSDAIGLVYDASGALLALLAPPSSECVVVVRIAPDAIEAFRVAELRGPSEEEPELDAMLAVGQVVYGVGNFGLIRLVPRRRDG